MKDKTSRRNYGRHLEAAPTIGDTQEASTRHPGGHQEILNRHTRGFKGHPQTPAGTQKETKDTQAAAGEPDTLIFNKNGAVESNCWRRIHGA